MHYRIYGNIPLRALFDFFSRFGDFACVKCTPRIHHMYQKFQSINVQGTCKFRESIQSILLHSGAAFLYYYICVSWLGSVACFLFLHFFFFFTAQIRLFTCVTVMWQPRCYVPTHF